MTQMYSSMGDHLYNPARDMAYALPRVIENLNEQIPNGLWDVAFDFMTALEDGEENSIRNLIAALESLAKLMLLTKTKKITDDWGITEALKESGWEDNEPIYQIIAMAYVGMSATTLGWYGQYEVGGSESHFSDLESIAEKAAKLSDTWGSVAGVRSIVSGMAKATQTFSDKCFEHDNRHYFCRDGKWYELAVVETHRFSSAAKDAMFAAAEDRKAELKTLQEEKRRQVEARGKLAIRKLAAKKLRIVSSTRYGSKTWQVFEFKRNWLTLWITKRWVPVGEESFNQKCAEEELDYLIESKLL